MLQLSILLLIVYYAFYNFLFFLKSIPLNWKAGTNRQNIFQNHFPVYVLLNITSRRRATIIKCWYQNSISILCLVSLHFNKKSYHLTNPKPLTLPYAASTKYILEIEWTPFHKSPYEYEAFKGKFLIINIFWWWNIFKMFFQSTIRLPIWQLLYN